MERTAGRPLTKQGIHTRQSLVSRRLTWFSLIVGTLGALLIAARRHPAPRPPRPHENGGMLPYFDQFAHRHGAGFDAFGGIPLPSPTPRYFANLACRSGDYVVSVRQVGSPQSYRNLLQNAPAYFAPLSLTEVWLSIQVMSPHPDEFADTPPPLANLRGWDDRGAALTIVPMPGSVAFAQGRSQRMVVSGLSPGARAIARLEGEIVPGNTGFAPTKPGNAAGRSTSDTHPFFRLRDVPLPNVPRVFGLADAAYLTASEIEGAQRQQTPRPDGTQEHVFSGPAARQLAGHFPPAVPPTGLFQLANRLVLTAGQANRFALPLPTPSPGETPVPPRPASLYCTLAPTLEAAGEMQVALRVAGADTPRPPVAAGTFTQWDSDPVVVVVPERTLFPRAGGHRWIGLRLDLFLDIPEDGIQRPYPHLPFQGVGLARGGSLSGQIQVGAEPLAAGIAVLDITPEQGLAAQKRNLAALAFPRTGERVQAYEIPLDTHGRFTLTNLLPGQYRVRLREAQPGLSMAVPVCSWNEYVQRRAGFTHPIWQTPLETHIEVRASGHSELPVWVCTDQPTGRPSPATQQLDKRA